MDPVSYAWRDPEFWGAEGLGCSFCYVEPAITWLSWGGIGFLCLWRWFPGRSEDWLLNWLHGQRVEYMRLKNRNRDEGRQCVLQAESFQEVGIV